VLRVLIVHKLEKKENWDQFESFKGDIFFVFQFVLMRGDQFPL